jgi:DNA-binding protein Fis
MEERIQQFMARKHSGIEAEQEDARLTPAAVAEAVLEKKLEDIATILCAAGTNKSRIYDEVLAMMEKSLFRIALRRSNHIKSAAASYLGINRNTFQKKMVKLGIDQDQG